MNVAGIDVGGLKKGFHVVIGISRSGRLAFHLYHDTNPKKIVQLCRQHDVQVVAIDAPCKWRKGKIARASELSLSRAGYRLYFTPTREEAVANRRGFFDWMLNGERLYKAFEPTHPVLAFPQHSLIPQCVETFPHAILRSLAPDLATKFSLKEKTFARLELLKRLGMDALCFPTADDVDAALCCYTAQQMAGKLPMEFHGDSETGFIVLPAPVR
jgi:predicted nuclease with RNAse H fold